MVKINYNSMKNKYICTASTIHSFRDDGSSMMWEEYLSI